MDAIYARQSIDKKDSISIETQINFCKRESTSPDGYKIFRDKGFSGKNMKRPDFQRMLTEIRSGIIKRVIVYKMDRFSRSILDFSETWNILQEFGVEFISMNEKFDTTTPMGRAMLYIIMVFAQLERETISERCTDNYYERIKNGVWPGGPAPFGFKNAEIINEGYRMSTLNPDSDLEIMIDNFQEYEKEGMSLGKLAKKRTQQNLKTNKDIVWNNISLSRLFRNPVYVKADILVYMYLKEKGYSFSNPVEEWDGTKAAHVVGKKQYISNGNRINTKAPRQTVSLLNIPGTIDSSLWLACNRKLDHNAQIKNSGAGKHTWLTGLIKCGQCGYALRITTYKNKENKIMKYLMCSGHSNLHCCDVKKFDLLVEDLEELVAEELNKAIEETKVEQIEMTDQTMDNDKKIRLAEIEEKIDRLIQAISEASNITMKYLNKEIEKLDSEKKQIMGNLEGHVQKRDRIKPIVFSELDFEGKKQIAQNYIKKILVYKDKMDIIWKV